MKDELNRLRFRNAHCSLPTAHLVFHFSTVSVGI